MLNFRNWDNLQTDRHCSGCWLTSIHPSVHSFSQCSTEVTLLPCTPVDACQQNAQHPKLSSIVMAFADILTSSHHHQLILTDRHQPVGHPRLLRETPQCSMCQAVIIISPDNGGQLETSDSRPAPAPTDMQDLQDLSP